MPGSVQTWFSEGSSLILKGQRKAEAAVTMEMEVIFPTPSTIKVEVEGITTWVHCTQEIIYSSLPRKILPDFTVATGIDSSKGRQYFQVKINPVLIFLFLLTVCTPLSHPCHHSETRKPHTAL